MHVIDCVLELLRLRWNKGSVCSFVNETMVFGSYYSFASYLCAKWSPDKTKWKSESEQIAGYLINSCFPYSRAFCHIRMYRSLNSLQFTNTNVDAIGIHSLREERCVMCGLHEIAKHADFMSARRSFLPSFPPSARALSIEYRISKHEWPEPEYRERFK